MRFFASSLLAVAALAGSSFAAFDLDEIKCRSVPASMFHKYWEESNDSYVANIPDDNLVEFHVKGGPTSNVSVLLTNSANGSTIDKDSTYELFIGGSSEPVIHSSSCAGCAPDDISNQGTSLITNDSYTNVWLAFTNAHGADPDKIELGYGAIGTNIVYTRSFSGPGRTIDQIVLKYEYEDMECEPHHIATAIAQTAANAAATQAVNEAYYAQSAAATAQSAAANAEAIAFNVSQIPAVLDAAVDDYATAVEQAAVAQAAAVTAQAAADHATANAAVAAHIANAAVAAHAPTDVVAVQTAGDAASIKAAEANADSTASMAAQSLSVAASMAVSATCGSETLNIPVISGGVDIDAATIDLERMIFKTTNQAGFEMRACYNQVQNYAIDLTHTPFKIDGLTSQMYHASGVTLEGAGHTAGPFKANGYLPTMTIQCPSEDFCNITCKGDCGHCLLFNMDEVDRVGSFKVSYKSPVYPLSPSAPSLFDSVDTWCKYTGNPRPTPSPTQFPTDFPTGAPTQFPTDFPTGAPTQFPTDFPTEAPTQFPTDAPTDAPICGSEALGVEVFTGNRKPVYEVNNWVDYELDASSVDLHSMTMHTDQSFTVVQCGYSPPAEFVVDLTDTPFYIDGLTPDLFADVPVSISCNGGMHALVRQANGDLYTFGDNNWGQLGLGSTANQSTPIKVQDIGPVSLTASGRHHSLAVSNDKLYGWGKNSTGQLGIGSNSNEVTSPTLVPNFPPDGTTIKAIAVGSYHSLCLLSNGDLYSWGWNDSGQLGIGSDVSKSAPVQVPLNLPSGTQVTAISCGSEYNLILLSNGDLYSWGDNTHGTLGLGSMAQKPEATKVDSIIMRVTAISAGAFHAACVLENGELLAWGRNQYGQLGDGFTMKQNLPQSVIPFGNGASVIDISLGWDFSLCALSNGDIYGWGSNSDGQLGTGFSQFEQTPKMLSRISYEHDIVSISAGAFHAICLLSNGDVYSWGYNIYGELGIGSSTKEFYPVKLAAIGAGPLGASIYGSGKTLGPFEVIGWQPTLSVVCTSNDYCTVRCNGACAICSLHDYTAATMATEANQSTSFKVGWKDSFTSDNVVFDDAGNWCRA